MSDCEELVGVAYWDVVRDVYSLYCSQQRNNSGSETAELLLGRKSMDDLVKEKIEQKKGAEVVN